MYKYITKSYLIILLIILCSIIGILVYYFYSNHYPIIDLIELEIENDKSGDRN